MNRTEVSAELMRGVPAESRTDHQRIAEAILTGTSRDKVLSMPEVDRWPETYSWLKSIEWK